MLFVVVVVVGGGGGVDGGIKFIEWRNERCVYENKTTGSSLRILSLSSVS